MTDPVTAVAVAGLVVGGAIVIDKATEGARLAAQFQSQYGPPPSPVPTAKAAGSGDNVVLYQQDDPSPLYPRVSGLNEFYRVATLLPGYARHAISNPANLEQALARHARIGHLVVAAHGWPESFPTQGGFDNRSPAPTWWESRLSGKLTPTSTISFAGCMAGANPGETVTAATQNFDGGAQSFAARLRDLLLGSNPDGWTIRAHSTTGPSSLNPFVRVFYGTESERGRPGRGTRFASRDNAERWLLGLAGGPGLGFDVPVTFPGFVAGVALFGVAVTLLSLLSPSRR
jgi:hypothetical protein